MSIFQQIEGYERRCAELGNRLPDIAPDAQRIWVARCRRLAELLRESKREHDRGDWPCEATFTVDPGPCSCGADEWNAKVDEALTENDT